MTADRGSLIFYMRCESGIYPQSQRTESVIRRTITPSIFREEVAKAGLERSINQYFAALTNLRSVGVMGDERTYDYAIALRAVETQDFMTADFSRLPWELLDTVSRRIVNEVKGVNRILYDVTSKPPATVELE